MPTSWTEVTTGASEYINDNPLTLWDQFDWDEANWDGLALPASWTEDSDGPTVWS